MLQAIYSRSSESVKSHIKRVLKTGSTKFMDKYYVGYSDKSIGDCGTTTLCFENISFLLAKCIQDSRLFNGQETSTRYMDFSKRGWVDPINTPASKAILTKWLAFYTDNFEIVREDLKLRYPKKEDVKDQQYETAMNAWTFDILRAFLPAGMRTQTSLHNTLRLMYDRLHILKHHPLEEMTEAAAAAHKLLQRKFKGSFRHGEHPATEEYLDRVTKKYTYHDRPWDYGDKSLAVLRNDIDQEELALYDDILSRRPKFSDVPKFLEELGTLRTLVKVDFGSFRDIQRHRSAIILMPLLTTKHGFNEWYLQELPESIREKALTLIAEQTAAIDAIDAPVEKKQYLIPLGFNVVTPMNFNIPSAVFVIELRTLTTVHPTAREVILQLYHEMKKHFPNIDIHADLSEDPRSFKRGLQTLAKRKKK